MYWVPVKGGSGGKKGSGRECEEGQEGLTSSCTGLGCVSGGFWPSLLQINSGDVCDPCVTMRAEYIGVGRY